MELSIRDWMIVIGVLLLLAVVLDGLRRAQKERRNQVRLSRNAKRMQKKRAQEETAEQHHIAELPKGGARVIGSRDEAFEEEVVLEAETPAQAPLNIDDGCSEVAAEESHEAFSAIDDYIEPEVEPIADEVDEIAEKESSDILFDEPVFDYEAKEKKAQKKSNKKSKPEPDIAKDIVDNVEPKLEQSNVPLEEEAEASAEPEIDDIIVLHAMAAKDQPFSGEELNKLLLACDCRFGKMDIFHRYENGATGAEQFSIVNMVEPGTFDLNNIESFSTPGVSFFMRLPGPKEPNEALTCMVETARCLVKNLQGTLKDEQRSTLTDQTVEHYRDRINAHKKRQLMK